MSEDNEQEAKVVVNLQMKKAQEDSDEDVATPLVDWQGIWNDALIKEGVAMSREEALKVERALRDVCRREMQTAVPDSQSNVFHATLSRIPSQPSSPTFSKSSIVFSDKKNAIPTKDNKSDKITIADASDSASGDMMFKRCKQTKVYATEEGLGGSHMVVKEDDTEEDWEEIDGAEVEDDWDFVEETERFKIKSHAEGGKMGFNDRTREFFEREKEKRERETKDGCKDRVSYGSKM